MIPPQWRTSLGNSRPMPIDKMIGTVSAGGSGPYSQDLDFARKDADSPRRGRLKHHAAQAGSRAATGQLMHPAHAALCCDEAGCEMPFRVGSSGMALSCEECDDGFRANERQRR